MDFIKILLADTTFTFAAEIVLRSVLMYFLIILVLRFSGKRGVRQLSIFEIAIILSLGSAAGDAMFYEEVPIIHAVIVFCSNYGFISLNNLLNDEIRCYLRHYWKVDQYTSSKMVY